MGGGSFRYSPCPFPALLLGVGVRVRTKAKKMVPNQPLNGSTVGGGVSFKASPGHIVPPDRRRRMEFAGGCQKVSSPRERSDPLFTGLCRAPRTLCAPPPSLLTASFSHSSAPAPKTVRRHAPSFPTGYCPPTSLCTHLSHSTEPSLAVTCIQRSAAHSCHLLYK